VGFQNESLDRSIAARRSAEVVVLVACKMRWHWTARAQSRGEHDADENSKTHDRCGSWPSPMRNLITESSAERPRMERGRSGWSPARGSRARPLRVGEAEVHKEQRGADPEEGSGRAVAADPESNGAATRGPCERALDGEACRRCGAQAREQDGERYTRIRGRGVGMLTKSRAGASRTTANAAAMLAVLWTLSGNFPSLGPLPVQAQGEVLVINPSWEWLGQELYECAVHFSPEKGIETDCECYAFNPNAAVPCSKTRPETPEAITEPGVSKSCTHDPKVQYLCNPEDPV